VAVSLATEAALWAAGVRLLAGMDEVGRGALAGPVSVGVVAVAPCDGWPHGLADSKELTSERREAIALELAGFGVARAVGSATSDEVDAVGIVGALRLAGLRALRSLSRQGVEPDRVLLDGHHDWLTPPAATLWEGAGSVERVPPVTTIVKGDGRCASIAAASVLAKVARDAEMVAAHGAHPAYGWRDNKGYGSAEHLEALARLGPTPLHRVSWNLPSRSRAGESEGMMGA